MSKGKSNKYTAKQVDSDGLIHYTDGEHQMWAELYQAQSNLAKQYMANEFVEGLEYINLPSDTIPQCADISEKLNKVTGWQFEPVPSLMGYDQFFTMLANKRFPAASFIRDKEDLTYVTEPDIFHEVFGHAPLLALSQVAEFSQFIGEMGCNMTAENRPWLARLYWFSIEFGLIKQRHHDYSGNNNKVTSSIKTDAIVPIGAALASSSTELVYASTSTEPQKRPFDVIEVMTMPDRFGIKQPIYYVIESFDQLIEFTKRNILADILQARKIGMQKFGHQ